MRWFKLKLDRFFRLFLFFIIAIKSIFQNPWNIAPIAFVLFGKDDFDKSDKK